MIDTDFPAGIEADFETALPRVPTFSLDGSPDLIAAPYLSKVRACHDIMGLLKRSRPSVQVQVTELEGIVTRAHRSLDIAKSRSGAADAQGNIDCAYQVLQELRRSRA